MKFKTSIIAGQILLIITLISCVNVVLMAQTRVDHEKKYFVDDSGNLFWQKKLPVYLFVSPEPSAEKGIKLANETGYGDPMYLDTEGANYIRSKWAMDSEGQYLMPKQEVLYEIFADGLPPNVALNFDGAPKYRSTVEAKIFYGAGLSLGIAAEDAMSGVESIWFSQQEEAFNIYKDLISMNEDGTYSIRVYAVDNVGNVSNDENYDFTVDLLAPNTSLSITGDYLDNVLSSRATITLTSVDLSSGLKNITYELDGNDTKSYSSKVNFEFLSEGEHVLTYRGYDNVSNEEATQTYHFFYDKSAPVVNVEILGDQYEGDKRTYVSERSKVKLSASDNKAGVSSIYYDLNLNKKLDYNDPFTLDLAHGIHKIAYYAEDKVGNIPMISERNQSVTYALDKISPTLANEFIGEVYNTRDTTFITDQTKIGLFAKDSDSGLKEINYSINDGDMVVYNDPFTLPEERYYTIEFQGTDNVGNKSSKTFNFFVDKTGPVLNYTISMEPIGVISLNDQETDLSVYSTGSKLYLSATDKIIDTKMISYSIDEGNFIAYGSPIELNQKGAINIRVTSIDFLNNKCVEDKSISLFVK